MPLQRLTECSPWVAKARNNQPPNYITLFHTLPNFLRWRPAQSLERYLYRYMNDGPMRNQFAYIVTHLREQLAKHPNAGEHSLVACISMSAHIQNEIIVIFSPNVVRPKASGSIVLKLKKDGTIKEIAREYHMNYTTDAAQLNRNHERY